MLRTLIGFSELFSQKKKKNEGFLYGYIVLFRLKLSFCGF